MEQTFFFWVVIMSCVTVALLMLYTVWTGMALKLPLDLHSRAARAETAKKIWDEADRKGCSVSDLPDVDFLSKTPVSATQAVRWAGKSTLRVAMEYRKIRKADESLRRERQRTLQREMKVRSRTI